MGFEPTITNCKFGALINCVIDQGIGYSLCGYRAQTENTSSNDSKSYGNHFPTFPNRLSPRGQLRTFVGPDSERQPVSNAKCKQTNELVPRDAAVFLN